MDTDALIERLRAVESSTLNMSDSVTTCWYRNPDGPEAATRIESLLARIEAAEKVIEPFARAGRKIPDWAPGHNRLSACPGFCGVLDVDDLRAAAQWQAGQEGEG